MSTNKSQNSTPNIISQSDPGNHINFVALNNLKAYNSKFIAYTAISLGITVLIVSIISLIHPLLAFFGIIGFFIVLITTIVLAVAEINKPNQIDFNNKEIFEKFASMNNFGYRFEDSTPRSPGSIFEYGINRKATHIITGNFRDLPFAFYKYSYIIRGPRTARKSDLQIIELTLPRKAPHMVIYSLVDYAIKRANLKISFDRSQKLKLEGDIYQYFDLYASDKSGISALKAIAPDIIEVLMKYSAKCDVEIIDNKIYFYWPRIATTQQEYETYFTTVGMVLDKIQKILISNNFSAQQSQSNAHDQDAAGYPKIKQHKTGSYIIIILSIFLLIIISSSINLTIGLILILVFTVLAIALLLHTVFADVKKSKLEKEFLKRK